MNNRRTRLKIISVFIITSIHSFVFSQYNSTLIFNSLDYPPLTDLTDIFIDSKGDIWIGTYANGLVHYNGREFENFRPKDGFVSSQAIQIFEDINGRIWAGSAEKGFSVKIQDNFQNYYSKDFNAPYFHRVHYDKRDNAIRFYIKNNGLYVYNYRQNGFRKTENYSIELYHIDSLMVYSDDFRSIYSSYGDSSYYIVDSRYINKTNRIFVKSTDHSILVDDVLYFAQDSTLFCAHLPDKRMEVKTCVSNLSGFVTSLTKIGERIYISCKKNSTEQIIYEYDLCLNYINKYDVKIPYTINKIAKDKAGNFWAISNNCLIKIITSLIEFPISQEKMLPTITSVIKSTDDKLWFASNSNGLAYYDGNKIIHCNSINSFNKDYLNCGFIDKANQINFNLSGTKPGILVINVDQSIKWINKGHFSFYSGRSQFGNIVLGMGNYEGVWISKTDPIEDVPDNFIKIDKSKGLQLRNVLSVSEDQLGNFWMGRTSQGIAVYSKRYDTVFNYLRNDTLYIPGGMSSVVDYTGKVWLGTDNGLYIANPDLFEKSKTKFDSFAKPFGIEIIGNSLVGSLIIKDSILYIGNALGLFLLDLKLFYNNQTSIQTISKDFGYSGGAIGQNAFHFDDQNKILWFYGSENVTGFFYKKYLTDTLTPLLFLEHLELNNGTRIKLFDHLKLPKGTSSFNLRLRIENCPYLYPNVQYIYSLDQQDQSRPDASPNLEIRNLSAGNHKMRIWAVKNGNIRSTPLELSFRIQPHWWENKWLWWLLGSGLALSLVILYRKNLQTLKQRSEIMKLEFNRLREKKERNNLQIQAIISQLNPHFVKNVLQWVSIRIAGDKESTRVLSKLSKNIQLVFENTKDKKSHHKLEGELEILRNYLVIQKYRFGDKFDYELPDPEILLPFLKQEVPLMILQIHAENACEHGVKHLSDRKGTIKVGLHDEPDFMHFTVEDNGIGRARAKKIESRGTQQGVKMLEELMAIYNEANVLKMSQWYEDDIFEKEGIRYGTRVNIRIPKNYNFEID